MRITSSMLYSTSLSNIQNNYRDLDKLQYQASSMKKVRLPSDSPIDAVKQLAYKSESFDLNQFMDNVGDAKDWLSTQDSTLSTANDIIQRARSLAVQGANDTLTDDDRELIAMEINQILENLLNISNTTMGGSYLFAGTEVLPEPFNSDPFVATRGQSSDPDKKMEGVITDVEYNGDYVAMYREIESGIKMKINENGNEIFQATPQKIKIPYTLSSASERFNLMNNNIMSNSTGYIKINDKLIHYDTIEDSLLDLKNKINASKSGATANVEGEYRANKIFNPPTATSITSGKFYLNDESINISKNDSITDIINKINSVSNKTGVTADLDPATFELILNGGFELSYDKSTGIDKGVQTILKDLGMINDTKVTGRNSGYSARADVKGGIFKINNTEITIADNASLSNIASAINAVSFTTNIAASVSNNRLVLSQSGGGSISKLVLEDSSNSSGTTSDVFKKLGFLTDNGNVRLDSDMTGVSNPQYTLAITAGSTHEMFIDDVNGSEFLENMGVIKTDDRKTSPNNITDSATVSNMNIFNVFIKLRDDLLAGKTIELNGNDIEYIDDSLKNLLNKRAAIGAKINRLDTVEERLGNLILNNEELLADVDEVDLASVITKLTQLQSVQQAALNIGARIFNMSLLNFLS